MFYGKKNINSLIEVFNYQQGNRSSGSPRHAAEEVVLSCGVVCVLDRVLPFASCLGSSPLAMSPHTCHIKKKRFQLNVNEEILQQHACPSLINVCMYSMCCVYVLTMRSLGVGVDLRPGFVRHVGSRSLQLGQRVLHIWLALRRKRKEKKKIEN